jgi:hypothetical protein
VEPFQGVQRLSGMWRSVLLGVALAGLLAGCSLNGGSDNLPGPSSGDGIPQYGVIEGRVVTTVCGGLLLSGGCGPTPYRGSLVFCTKMGQIGVCPSARVDASGHYRIVLRRGRHALIPAPGNGNVVQVKPRWVVVVAGQTRTLNIKGGNLMR